MCAVDVNAQGGGASFCVSQAYTCVAERMCSAAVHWGCVCGFVVLDSCERHCCFILVQGRGLTNYQCTHLSLSLSVAHFSGGGGGDGAS